ncbi:MAG: hypothetical protein EOO39_24170 [Cytophagaceae bacterium]|nr:MAG: hypothetical protein EOO39_24170 [Cytophagaceae bacterium]
MVLAVTVSSSITPDFATTLVLCSGSTPPALAGTSPNGITGTWSPSVINNTANASYVFTPDAGQCAVPVTLTVTITTGVQPSFANSAIICFGAVPPSLATTSNNGVTGTWSPSTVSNTASGSYVFTPTPGQCGATSHTLTVTVVPNQTPDFPTALAFCTGATVPPLSSTSPNGISGTWSPATISNMADGTYNFTPALGQCATPVTLTVTISNSIVPDFQTSLTVCSGSPVPTLATTSPNGISGTWSPAVISSTSSGTYVFTPTPGQCASAVTLSVTITAGSVTPDFATTLSICSLDTAPVLATTSPNGISGIWSPAVISTTTSANYLFTPNAGQCATPITLAVTVTPAITPGFPTTLTICQNDAAPILATTSPNGIIGTWTPSVVSNATSGSYIFTPTSGQCASGLTLQVTITPTRTPDFATTLAFCNGSSVPALSTTSPNGVTGTWSPAVISNTVSGTYAFTPNAGQCATPVTLSVTITNSIVPDFTTTMSFCSTDTAPALATTSPNGVTGNWSPTFISTLSSGTYVFTPNPGQCATSITLAVTITPATTPNFPAAITLCPGDTAPVLATTSPNGIS